MHCGVLKKLFTQVSEIAYYRNIWTTDQLNESLQV